MKDTSNKIVNVIIVTAGVNDYVISCVESLKKQTHSKIEISVIDNSLNPQIRDRFLYIYPRGKIYPQEKKMTYCEAMNFGIKQSRGDFIFCLNDDVVLEGWFLEEALRGFRVDPKIGMVSGKIMRIGGEILDTTGLFLSLWRSARERGYGVKDKGQFDKEGYIFGVNGAAALYSREMLEDIKEGEEYFDSDFHFFYEDLDIAWRAQRFGWKGYYITSAVAYHVRGATARKICGKNKPYSRRYLINDELEIDLIKNRYLAIIKNESFLGFLSHFLFIILYDIVICGYVLFSRPYLVRMFISKLVYFKSAFNKRNRGNRKIALRIGKKMGRSILGRYFGRKRIF